MEEASFPPQVLTTGLQADGTCWPHFTEEKPETDSQAEFETMSVQPQLPSREHSATLEPLRK